MPVIDLQRRLRQIGRIRIGYSEKGSSNGREYKIPKRSQNFILTSSDRRALEVAAGKYGGKVQPWSEQQGQFILITERNEIPVLVARMAPDTQWYEHWNAGECLRRCNGEAQENGQACQCPIDPKVRAEAAKSRTNPACKLITRVNVMLPEVPDLGVWRLDTHGYYAATELPTTLEAIWMIAPKAEFAPAFIGIEPRKSGKKSWLTPVLRLKQTSEELHEIEASGGSFFARPQIAAPSAALAIEAPAVEYIDTEFDDAPEVRRNDPGEVTCECGTALNKNRITYCNQRLAGEMLCTSCEAGRKAVAA